MGEACRVPMMGIVWKSEPMASERRRGRQVRGGGRRCGGADGLIRSAGLIWSNDDVWARMRLIGDRIK